jgi:hypothetical protein
MEEGSAVVRTEAAHIAVARMAARIAVRDRRGQVEEGSAGVVDGVREVMKVVVGTVGLEVVARSIVVGLGVGL